MSEERFQVQNERASEYMSQTPGWETPGWWVGFDKHQSILQDKAVFKR
jgi:hypothetical protein